MSETTTLQVLKATAKNSFINKFTLTPPIYWLIQILVVSFFSMYFFVILADYVGNPEVTVTYVVVGNAVQSVAITTLASVSQVPGTEKHTGTLSGLIQTPTPLFTIFLGMSSVGIFTGFCSMLVSLAYAAFIFNVSFAACNFLSVAIIMIFTCLSLTGLGLMVGSVGIHLRTSAIIANIVSYIGLLISGVNFPISYLPDWVQIISNCMPLTYAVEATRSAVNGASLADLWLQIVMMTVLGIIFAIIAWYSFRFFEKKSRISGTSDNF